MRACSLIQSETIARRKVDTSRAENHESQLVADQLLPSVPAGRLCQPTRRRHSAVRNTFLSYSLVFVSSFFVLISIAAVLCVHAQCVHTRIFVPRHYRFSLSFSFPQFSFPPRCFTPPHPFPSICPLLSLILRSRRTHGYTRARVVDTGRQSKFPADFWRNPHST